MLTISSWWEKIFGTRKRSIQLICFDVDNTLFDFAVAEAETEVYLAQLLARDIQNKRNALVKLNKNRLSGRTKQLDTEKVTPAIILRTFTDVKNSHLHRDLNPQSFSRTLWIRETLEQLELDDIFGHDMSLFQKNAELYEQKYWQYLIPHIRLFPQTIPTLQSLKQSGKYKLALITDSDGQKETKMQRIKAAHLDGYFDFVITSDDTGVNKPDIKNFELAKTLSGIDPTNSMMVGDHPPIDLISAKKLGFTTVWTKERFKSDVSYPYVDYEVHDIGQLKDILDILEK